jgi:hypothetical protein
MPASLTELLGKADNSPQVMEAIYRLELHDIEEDPPFRRYVGSRQTGIDLLVEQGRVIAAQVFVKAIQGFSAFPYMLPYGLHKDLTQDGVHHLLGNPSASDEFDSRYENNEHGIDLIINFDKLSEITYLNIRAKAPSAKE